jgi:hypothetical protein
MMNEGSSSLHRSASHHASGESVDEEFVSLHRSPILAYFSLLLLHGIISFLAPFPYALLPPSQTAAADSIEADSPSDRAHHQRYQHLISILLPPSTSDHVVLNSSSAIPSLSIKSGVSWVLDHSDIQ